MNAPNNRNRPITYEERLEIEKYVKEKSCAHIASILNRSKNAIVVEIRRNGGKENYNAELAHKEALKRLKKRNESIKRKLKKRAEQEVPARRKWVQQRIESLEMQVEILLENLRRLQKC